MRCYFATNEITVISLADEPQRQCAPSNHPLTDMECPCDEREVIFPILKMLPGNTKLTFWRQQFDTIDDKATQEFFGRIAEHVMSMKLPTDPEKIRFLGGADPWLIAKAATTGKTIVTHEVLAPDNSKKIKIPNICKDFDVNYITSFDLLDVLQARLVIERP